MTKLKYLKDKDPWMLAEDIPNMDFFFSDIWLTCFVNEFRCPSGKAYKKILSIYKGYHLWFYYGKQDSKEVGDFIVKKFIKNPKFTKRVNKGIVIWSDRLRQYVDSLPQEKLERFSNKRLWQFYKKHDEIHTKYYQWGWIPVAADMFHNNLTERLKQYLRSINITEDKVNEYLVLLTQSTKKSLIQIQNEEFLKIAINIQGDKYHKKLFEELWRTFKEREVAVFGFKTHSKEYEELLEKRVEDIKDKIKPEIYKLIQKHYQKYFYVNHLWVGEVSSFDYFLKELVRLIGSGADLKKKYQKDQGEFKKVLTKRKRLIKKLKIKNPWLTVIDAWGDFMVTKIYRRYAQIYAVYKMEAILQEIGRRFGLNLMPVRFMLPEEIKKALLVGKINKKEIKKRTRFCVYYLEKGKGVVFTGKKAKQLTASATAKKLEKVVEIKGQCGCVGKARGTVKIIIRPEDMHKMEKGDVLVSIATDPDIVPAMKKAAAIVTEQGGVTCHAAIVSRELNIPCVIGTKIATRVLRDGDRVKVDATKGIVKKL